MLRPCLFLAPCSVVLCHMPLLQGATPEAAVIERAIALPCGLITLLTGLPWQPWPGLVRSDFCATCMCFAWHS